MFIVQYVTKNFSGRPTIRTLKHCDGRPAVWSTFASAKKAAASVQGVVLNIGQEISQ